MPILLLLIVLISLPGPRSLVERIPISITLPLKPPVSIVSPTLYVPSNTRPIPDRMSATMSFAPREIARDRRPIDARSVAVSTPRKLSVRKTIMAINM